MQLASHLQDAGPGSEITALTPFAVSDSIEEALVIPWSKASL